MILTGVPGDGQGLAVSSGAGNGGRPGNGEEGGVGGGENHGGEEGGGGGGGEGRRGDGNGGGGESAGGAAGGGRGKEIGGGGKYMRVVSSVESEINSTEPYALPNSVNTAEISEESISANAEAASGSRKKDVEWTLTLPPMMD